MNQSISVDTFCKVLLSVSLLMPLSTVKAEETAGRNKYHIGGHSMIISGSMDLSDLDAEFDDLDADGIDGPHHSSLYFLVSSGKHISVGFETLAGNSSTDERTTMNFQGVGILLNLSYGTRWFVTGGLHAGGVIANVTSSDTRSASPGVGTGTHFKDTGVFMAPYIGVGYRFGEFDLSLNAKWLEFVEGEDSDDLDALSAQYIGVGAGYHF